jgi:putative DNA primase/helicase
MVRFLTAAMTLPVLPDQSGSLANRLVALRMSQSFGGRGNPSLEDRLVRELPRILRWAIEGFVRLQQRGAFALTEDGKRIREDVRQRANPLARFLTERCELVSDATVGRQVLFAAYLEWARAEAARGRWHDSPTA